MNYPNHNKAPNLGTRTNPENETPKPTKPKTPKPKNPKHIQREPTTNQSKPRRIPKSQTPFPNQRARNPPPPLPLKYSKKNSPFISLGT